MRINFKFRNVDFHIQSIKMHQIYLFGNVVVNKKALEINFISYALVILNYDKFESTSIGI